MGALVVAEVQNVDDVPDIGAEPKAGRGPNINCRPGLWASPIANTPPAISKQPSRVAVSMVTARLAATHSRVGPR